VNCCSEVSCNCTPGTTLQLTLAGVANAGPAAKVPTDTTAQTVKHIPTGKTLANRRIDDPNRYPIRSFD
jgi:hypothetical protein